MSEMNLHRAPSAERAYRMALRAYHPAYRERCGEEVLATALELGGGRWSIREMVGLVVGGMRSRYRAGVSGPSSSVWLSGLRLAVFFVTVQGLADTLGYSGLANVSLWVLLLSVGSIVISFWTTGWIHASAISATVVLSFFTAAVALGPGVWSRYILASALVVGAAWWVALKGDGRRVAAPLPGALFVAGWVVITAAMPKEFYAILPFQSMGSLLVMLAVSIVAVACASIDPRLLVAVMASFGAYVVFDLLTRSQIGSRLSNSGVFGLTSVVIIGVLAASFRLGQRRLQRL